MTDAIVLEEAIATEVSTNSTSMLDKCDDTPPEGQDKDMQEARMHEHARNPDGNQETEESVPNLI
ncbi:hypothetical protein HK102_000084, partial [Quaeritorhiza haematococci]